MNKQFGQMAAGTMVVSKCEKPLSSVSVKRSSVGWLNLAARRESQ